MIQVVMNDQLLCRVDGALHRVKLLDNVKTRPLVLHHRDHILQMSACSFKPLNYGRMDCMEMFFGHSASYPLG
jgi:hypothetical protein